MAKLIRSSNDRPHRSTSWFGKLASLSEQSARETERLSRSVQAKISRARYVDPKRRRRLAHQIAHQVLGARALPTELRQRFFTCATDLVERAIAPLYRLPRPTNDDPAELLQLRRSLTHQLDALANEAKLIAECSETLKRCLATLSAALEIKPDQANGIVLPLPNTAIIKQPKQVIHSITQALVTLAPDPAQPTIRPGDELGRHALHNVLAASRLTLEEAQKRPPRMVWPDSCNLMPADLVETYLANTPFADFLTATTSVSITSKLWQEHAVVTATTGWGKSQLLQALLLRHFEDPERPAVVVIDSQGDLFRTISRLKCFDPDVDTRLVIIDPRDNLAFNLFHVDRTMLDRLSQKDREEFLAGIIELFNYIAGALLGAELTPKMQVVFRFLSQWLIEIPGATIHTLLALLTDPAPYLHHVQRLPPTAQSFINDQLLVERSQYRETCQQIARRLYHVLSNPTFERIFSSPENKFDLGKALNDGRVVLVNTAKAHLKSEWSGIFGRFVIAQLMQATFARSFIAQHERRPAYVHVDESSEYLDENIDQLLIQARKFAVSLTCYMQTTEQALNAGLRASFLAIPAIRFTGGISDPDATLLAKEMNTMPEFLKSMRKHDSHAEWAVYVRGLTPTAVRYTVPFLQAERAPKMSDAAYRRLMQRIHAEVAQTSTSAPSTPPTHPTGNSGDSY